MSMHDTARFGLRVGHAQCPDGKTGVSVLCFDGIAPVAIEQRGGAPGSREFLIAKPENMVPGIHALVLTGGSAMGLETTCGVSRVLRGDGIGFATSGGPVPIVMGAVIFDLQEGVEPPDLAMGEEAARSAAYRWEDGKVGASCGAASHRGSSRPMPTRLGVAVRAKDDWSVLAIAVVNSFGEVLPVGGSADRKAQISTARLLENTTLVAVVTDARLDKTSLRRVAILADDGLSRSIFPAHTAFDGDAVFAISAGGIEADATEVGMLAGLAVEDAIRKAAFMAEKSEHTPVSLS